MEKILSRAEILCVGTELLIGDIVNTNAAYLSRRLATLGIGVYRQSVVGDNKARLAEDLRGKMENIKGAVDRIEELSLADVSTYRERLAERIREALKDCQITPDETRLLTECAIHADKVAVDEEMVRLRTHFGAFEEILSSGEPVGRKLDFLMQEMNREINTTGSKCSDAQIAHLVVDVKCELEKIREQIQNLE